MWRKIFDQLRPVSVTITRWGVFTFAMVHLWQAYAIYDQLALQLRFNPSFPPQVRLTISLFWAITWFGLWLLLWQRHPASRWVVLLAIPLYTINHIGLVVLSYSLVAQRGLWGDVLTAGLIALFVGWALNRPAVRPYFHP